MSVVSDSELLVMFVTLEVEYSAGNISEKNKIV